MPDCNGCATTGLLELANTDCAKTDQLQLTATNMAQAVSNINNKFECGALCIAEPGCTFATWVNNSQIEL